MPRLITPTVVADFRNRLCEVAAELYVELGRDGFNMRELAKRLRVSPMTAYRYFKDKNEILASLRARAFARFADRLEIAQAVSDSQGEKNVAIVRAYVQFALDEPASYRLMFDLFQSGGHTLPELALQERRARAALVEHARLMVKEGILEGDPELIGQVFWSALHGVVALHLVGSLCASEFENVLSETMRALVGAFHGDFPPRVSAVGAWPAFRIRDQQKTALNYSDLAVLSAAE